MPSRPCLQSSPNLGPSILSNLGWLVILWFQGHAPPSHEILPVFHAIVFACTFALALSFARARLAFGIACPRPPAGLAVCSALFQQSLGTVSYTPHHKQLP